jgi:ABC-type Mn2+/Zn2+ transport system ATPase subunit
VSANPSPSDARVPAVLLRADRASFGYSGVPVVANVDLEIRTGDFVGIVGPNGSGKTTLFRGLLGLVPPLSGRVVRSARAIGYVPQRETLDPIYPVTVEEVVQMGARRRSSLFGISREARELARACLERVGMVERRSDAFSSLSGGQRQRVLIARALMVAPELLLLDEPTSGVDSGAQARIRELLVELNTRESLAILLVSHQVAMLRETVRRVLWVADGGIVDGSADEMLRADRLDRLFAPSGAARERS